MDGIEGIEVSINDGLLNFPYNHHDYTVVFIFVFGYFIRMYLMNKARDLRLKPTLTDWFGTLVISAFFTVMVYEIAKYTKMSITALYLILTAISLFSKDILDYLIISKDGRDFVINTFKEIINSILEKKGYRKEEKE
jgi:ABC-type Fe3+-siderophore transport system permease subunit